MPTTPSKARILVELPSGTKQITLQYNPSEYSVSSSNEYSKEEIPNNSMPVAQFVSGDNDTLSLDLFFDTYEQGTDVRNLTQDISILQKNADLHAPPNCTFAWGSFTFRGIVTNLTQKFTMFLNTGVPVRARLSLTIQSQETLKEQMQNIANQSADRTKQYTLKEGDQLWMIASKEYDSPAPWREIASANQIVNPKKIIPGKRLVIPRLE